MKLRVAQLVMWFVGYLIISSISAPKAHALLDCTNQQITPGAEEPHPLRPNPGQVCTPDIPQTSRIECGTDIVVVKTMKMSRGGAGCTPFDPTDYGKHIECTRTVTVNDAPIQIGLQDLELPIAGVASNTAISDTISDALKMRNYTSWYLQGALEQADQELISLTVTPAPPITPGITPPGGVLTGPTKLMVLGDSITEADSPFGYKCYLHDKLESTPGTQGKATFFGNKNGCVDHEGYTGYSTSGILEDPTTHENHAASAAALKPDAVLIHLGTNEAANNDAYFDNITIPNLKNIIDAFRAQNANAAIFLAQIIPWDNPSSRVPSLNAKIASLAAYSTATSRITIVDQYSGFPTSYLRDRIHPNEDGAKLMADKFFAALVGGAFSVPGGASNDPERFLKYAGPIKKLISPDVINQRRIDMIDSARQGKSYNQIVGYVDKTTNTVIGRKKALEYFTQHPSGTDIEKVRLASFPDDRRNQKYLEGDQEALKWYALWRQVPFVQTVDLTGEIFATLAHLDNNNMLGVTNATLSFDPNLTVSDLSVAFPHLAEDDQLAQLLQSVFIPSDVAQTTNYQQIDDYTQNTNFTDINRGAPWATQGCKPFEAGETPWNPGDRLESSTTIKGRFSFTKNVTYSFDWWTAAQLADLTSRGISPYIPVEVPVSAALSIFSRTPQALDNVYDRLLKGPGAVFKALYPLDYTPEDRPAAAGLTNVNCGPDCEVWPANEEGRKAEMFFPHLGSILLDWHQKLQCMLDPLGRCGRDVIGSQGNSGTGGVCENAGFEVTDAPALGPGGVERTTDEILADIEAQTDVDASILKTILTIEGGPAYDPYQTSFCNVNSCSATGPFQIVTGWEHVNCDPNQCGGSTCGNYCTRAQNGENVSDFFDLPPAIADLEGTNRCNFEESAVLAAYLLKLKGGLSQNSVFSATPAFRENLIKAFMGYYGNQYDDAKTATENCHDPGQNNERRISRFGDKTYCEYAFELVESFEGTELGP